MKKMARMSGMFISILLFCCFMHGSAFAGSWQWIDGRCYYFDPAQGGAMYIRGTFDAEVDIMLKAK